MNVALFFKGLNSFSLGIFVCIHMHAITTKNLETMSLEDSREGTCLWEGMEARQEEGNIANKL